MHTKQHHRFYKINTDCCYATYSKWENDKCCEVIRRFDHIEIIVFLGQMSGSCSGFLQVCCTQTSHAVTSRRFKDNSIFDSGIPVSALLRSL